MPAFRIGYLLSLGDFLEQGDTLLIFVVISFPLGDMNKCLTHVNDKEGKTLSTKSNSGTKVFIVLTYRAQMGSSRNIGDPKAAAATGKSILPR